MFRSLNHCRIAKRFFWKKNRLKIISKKHSQKKNIYKSVNQCEISVIWIFTVRFQRDLECLKRDSFSDENDIDLFRKATIIINLFIISFFFRKKTFIIFSKKELLFWKKSKNFVFNIFSSLKVLRSDEKKQIQIAIRLDFNENADEINWKKYWKRSMFDSRKKNARKISIFSSKSFDF